MPADKMPEVDRMAEPPVQIPVSSLSVGYQVQSPTEPSAMVATSVSGRPLKTSPLLKTSPTLMISPTSLRAPTIRELSIGVKSKSNSKSKEEENPSPSKSPSKPEGRASTSKTSGIVPGFSFGKSKSITVQQPAKKSVPKLNMPKAFASGLGSAREPASCRREGPESSRKEPQLSSSLRKSGTTSVAAPKLGGTNVTAPKFSSSNGNASITMSKTARTSNVSPKKCVPKHKISYGVPALKLDTTTLRMKAAGPLGDGASTFRSPQEVFRQSSLQKLEGPTAKSTLKLDKKDLSQSMPQAFRNILSKEGSPIKESPTKGSAMKAPPPKLSPVKLSPVKLLGSLSSDLIRSAPSLAERDAVTEETTAQSTVRKDTGDGNGLADTQVENEAAQGEETTNENCNSNGSNPIKTSESSKESFGDIAAEPCVKALGKFRHLLSTSKEAPISYTQYQEPTSDTQKHPPVSHARSSDLNDVPQEGAARMREFVQDVDDVPPEGAVRMPRQKDREFAQDLDDVPPEGAVRMPKQRDSEIAPEDQQQIATVTQKQNDIDTTIKDQDEGTDLLNQNSEIPSPRVLPCSSMKSLVSSTGSNFLFFGGKQMTSPLQASSVGSLYSPTTSGTNASPTSPTRCVMETINEVDSQQLSVSMQAGSPSLEEENRTGTEVPPVSIGKTNMAASGLGVASLKSPDKNRKLSHTSMGRSDSNETENKKALIAHLDTKIAESSSVIVHVLKERDISEHDTLKDEVYSIKSSGNDRSIEKQNVASASGEDDEEKIHSRVQGADCQFHKIGTPDTAFHDIATPLGNGSEQISPLDPVDVGHIKLMPPISLPFPSPATVSPMHTKTDIQGSIQRMREIAAAVQIKQNEESAKNISPSKIPFHSRIYSCKSSLLPEPKVLSLPANLTLSSTTCGNDVSITQTPGSPAKSNVSPRTIQLHDESPRHSCKSSLKSQPPSGATPPSFLSEVTLTSTQANKETSVMRPPTTLASASSSFTPNPQPTMTLTSTSSGNNEISLSKRFDLPESKGNNEASSPRRHFLKSHSPRKSSPARLKSSPPRLPIQLQNGFPQNKQKSHSRFPFPGDLSSTPVLQAILHPIQQEKSISQTPENLRVSHDDRQVHFDTLRQTPSSVSRIKHNSEDNMDYPPGKSGISLSNAGVLSGGVHRMDAEIGISRLDYDWHEQHVTSSNVDPISPTDKGSHISSYHLDFDFDSEDDDTIPSNQVIVPGRIISPAAPLPLPNTYPTRRYIIADCLYKSLWDIPKFMLWTVPKTSTEIALKVPVQSAKLGINVALFVPRLYWWALKSSFEIVVGATIRNSQSRQGQSELMDAVRAEDKVEQVEDKAEQQLKGRVEKH